MTVLDTLNFVAFNPLTNNNPIAVPKTEIVTQPPQQQTVPKDTERTDFTPIRPQPPLPNQQDNRDKR